MTSDVIERYLTTFAQAAEAVGLPKEVRRDIDRATNRAIQLSGKFYRFHHDFETYCDESVVDIGQDAYSAHPSCEILMLAYGFDDNDVEQWVPAEGQKTMPSEIREALDDPNAIKFAWNKPFEWSIWKNVAGIETPHNRWRDPMVMAMAASFPGKLSKVGELLGLEEDQQKLKDGKLLVTTFCSPRKPSKHKPWTRVLPQHEPEKWERFKLYNKTDVVSERAIYHKLRPYNLSLEEWEMWYIDQEINAAGIPVNMKLVDNAIELYEALITDRLQRAGEITGLANPNSNQQLLPWLKKYGYKFDDLKKGHVETAARGLERIIEEGADEEFDGGPTQAEVLEVLEMRLELAAAAPKKFYAIKRAVGTSEKDGPVLRWAFQFMGAGRTGRWAGRLVQVQNLPRPHNDLEKGMERHAQQLTIGNPALIEFLYDKGGDHKKPGPMDLLKSSVRPAFQAPPGYMFFDADLSAIENRVLGWMSECDKILRVFRLGRDPYIQFVCYMYGGTYEERWHEYKELKIKHFRQIAKPGVLGCGYQLGAGTVYFNEKTGENEATGLLGYAWAMQIFEFTMEQSKLSVDTFRREFSEVKDYWYAIERAAVTTVKTGRVTECGPVRFELQGPFLCMILPSGRPLRYYKPVIKSSLMPWKGKNGEQVFRDALVYQGLNDKKIWGEVTTHGGKLTENGDQAISRDLLAHALKMSKREYNQDLRIHVHDQAIGLVKLDRAKEQLQILKQCLNTPPKWAHGLPISSEGFTSQVFIKD